MSNAEENDDESVTKKDVKAWRPLAFKKAATRSEDVTAAEIEETTRRAAEARQQAELRRRRTDELIEAISNGDSIEQMKALLDEGVDFNAYSRNGDTVMHVAVQRRNPGALILLLQAGMDPHVRNFCGVTPLIAAAAGYETAACGVILADADPDLSFHAIDGKHALHIAAREYNKTRLVEKLLERGVPADIEDGEGRTPLWYALACKTDAVEVICMAGGFRKKDMQLLREAMAVKKLYGESWDYEYLLKHVAKLDPQALKDAFPRSGPAAPSLIQPEGRAIFSQIDHSTGSSFQFRPYAGNAGANNARNHDGQTPLMAALNSNVSLWATRDLAYDGVSTARDNAGRTALHFAVRHVHPGDHIAGVLLSRGADMDAQDIFGRTPLMVSVAKCGDHIERFVERGANLGLKDLLGLTAMDIAKIRKSDYAVEKLTKKKEPRKPFPGASGPG
jgi:ankyrin repeat protein